MSEQVSLESIDTIGIALFRLNYIRKQSVLRASKSKTGITNFVAVFVDLQWRHNGNFG